MLRAVKVLAVGAAVVMAGAGCGSAPRSGSPAAPGSTATRPSGSPAPRGSGQVQVLYAGSLVEVMQKRLGPAFKAATGYSVQGFAAGSSALASQIRGKIRRGDVFISASPSVNASLEGPDNGAWVSWYATFAISPLVLGYNPRSRFADALRTKPWYQVITEPGFLLGRTDPATDPKGKLTVTALQAAARQHSDPALTRVAASSSGVYPEETLVGRLQAGQLDAGFFYTSETTAASIPTVPLSGQNLKATYTVTVLHGASDQAGAEAFVKFLLGPTGQGILQKAGFQAVRPPGLSGSGMPPGISRAAATAG